MNDLTDFAVRRDLRVRRPARAPVASQRVGAVRGALTALSELAQVCFLILAASRNHCGCEQNQTGN